MNEFFAQYLTKHKKYKELAFSLLFWGLVFLLDAGPNWELYSSPIEVLETIGIIVTLQFFTATLSINYLIPNLLDQRKHWQFFVTFLVLLLVASELSVISRYLYIETKYSASYEKFLELYGHLGLLERTFSFWSFKYIFFSKVPLMLFPSAILMAHNFYKNQQRLLQVSEQKKQAELTALKNQLNPHFIFNTLNNLYSLTLSKSNLAPLVIEKLSNILDYMLYRCDEKYVSLDNEIKLIHNYLDLEKIRYGNRLEVCFNHTQSDAISIAPLILLGLIENACKHSARNELNQAQVNIKITANKHEIHVKISNSKPIVSQVDSLVHNRIGLDNMKKQLNLLYPESHQLQIDESSAWYQVTLLLKIADAEPNA